jgi:hypothetical protein
MRISQKLTSMDAAGVGMSVLCIMHCLALPVTAVVAPILVPSLANTLGVGHGLHLWLLLAAIPVSLGGLWWSMRVTHSGFNTLLVAALGLAIMTLGATHILSDVMATIVTLIGVTVLAAAHIYNWHSRARTGHNHERECGICDHHEHAPH